MKGKRPSYILAFLVLALVVSFLVAPVGAQAQGSASESQIAAINNQINLLLKQLVALLTMQLQDLQQQVVVKLGQQPAVTTPPAAMATTTAQTAATSTAATSTAEATPATVSLEVQPSPQPARRKGVLSFPVISITVATSSTSTISVTASATNDDGSSSNIAEVVFTDIATNFGADTASPYASGNRVLTAGVHTISGVATDVQGQAKRSASTTLPSVPW